MLYLRGWVCDTANNPLADATVKVVDKDYAGTTDSTGRYTIGPMPEGKYAAFVRKDGYLSFVEEGIVVSAATGFYKHNYRLRMGTDAVQESLVVRGYGRLSGFVRDWETKQAVIDAVVSVEGAEQRVKTGLGGWFLFKRIPAGTYLIITERSGYKTTKNRDVVVKRYAATELTIVLKGTTLQGPPMCKPDRTGSVRVYSEDEINKLPGH
jgi:hypothetical protein